MDIGEAVKALESGERVAREGWNGKNMWLALMPELRLPPNNSSEPGPKVNDRTAKFIGANRPLHCGPYIAMMTASGVWQPGWLAAQPDLLAKDWFILPPVVEN